MNSWVSKSKGMLAAAIALSALGGTARAGGGDDSICSNATLRGDYAFSVLTVAAAAGPNVVVGLARFDGKGGYTQIDYPGNGLSMTPPVTDFRTGETGSYKVNSDCTGFQDVDLGMGGTVENAFVISNGGRAIHAVTAQRTHGGTSVPVQIRIDFWKVAPDQDTEYR
jgi:hypothetical protein